MTDFKLLSECFRCKRKKLYIAKRVIRIPNGLVNATSREFFCSPCFKDIKGVMEINL